MRLFTESWSRGHVTDHLTDAIIGSRVMGIAEALIVMNCVSIGQDQISLRYTAVTGATYGTPLRRALQVSMKTSRPSREWKRVLSPPSSFRRAMSTVTVHEAVM